MKLKIREWGGLYTNVDEADKNIELFSHFKNIKVHPGFIEAKSVFLADSGYTLPLGHTIVKEIFVFMDEDRYQNELISSKLVNNYHQNLQKYHFRITYDGVYHFWFRLFDDTDFTTSLESVHTGIAEQDPKVVNEKGVLKIFFFEEALWIGKINRTYWNATGSFTRGPEFLVEPLVEIFNKFQLPFWLFSPEPNLDFAFIDVEAKTVAAYPNGRYNNFITHSLELTDIDPDTPETGTVFYEPTDGLVQLYVGSADGSQGDDTQAWFFPEDGFDILRVKQEVIDGHYSAVTDPWVKYDDGSSNGRWEKLYGRYFGWVADNVGGTNQRLSDFVNGITGYNKVVTSSEFLVEDAYFEIVTTVLVDGDEYPLFFQVFRPETSAQFFIKLESSIFGIIESLTSRASTVIIYMRYGLNEEETKKRDYEQTIVLPLVTGKPLDFPYTISRLTPNGIFLTQTIGKSFDRETYEIITNPEDYINAGGVAFILKDGNIHYPAIGGATILNGTFYKENTIPDIEGQLLASFGNLLGVFSAQRELMTLIDFQSVEAQLIFYIKGQFSHKIRDYKDLIQTAEGVFIHLKEGIFATNGFDRKSISTQIDDIIRENYDKGNIFYNSFNKELYYVTDNRFFVYDAVTGTWSELSVSDLKYSDIIEDFEGGVYLVTEQKLLKLTGTEISIGEFDIRLLDLQESSFGKTVHYIAADAAYGTVKALEKEESTDNRSVLMLYKSIADRKPATHIDEKVQFTGKLYNLELEVDINPIVKL